MMKLQMTILFLILFVFISAEDTLPDHTIYDGLLKKHVKENRVDYQNFLLDKKELKLYLKKLDSVTIKNLNKNEQLALFINAYNAFTLDLILDNYSDKFKSIKDLKKPWDTKFCSIGGIKYSLNQIENQFLREQLKEPRIHFAINCASISCPPLQPYAFLGDKIEEQLTEVTTKFMQNPLGVKINQQTLEVNQIFNWFKKDFESKDTSLPAFIIQYLPKDTQKTLPEISKISISYQEYNWNLNDLKKEGK